MGNKFDKVKLNISFKYCNFSDVHNCIENSFNRKNLIHISASEVEENGCVNFIPRRKVSLKKEYKHSQAVWPISIVESIFLPEFKIRRFSKDLDIVIIGLTAKGAFGKVFKIKDIKTEKIYAMKILQKSKIIKEDAVLQVKDEIKIQSVCGHHEFIVNCIFSWQTHTQLFIVSEFKSGGELLDLMEEYGSLSEEVVRIYVAEIAIAIDFLHNAGVIHRDLKPENILLDEHSHICLTDFGLSKWLSIGSRTNTVCGTDRYMAPEIRKCELYSHAVDWWSLGIVSCSLLTNKFPEVVESKIQLPENVPLSTASKDLLLRLLTYDPAKRLRSLYTLKTIAFFKNFDFKNILEKKVNPKELLHKFHKKKTNVHENIFNDF